MTFRVALGLSLFVGSLLIGWGLGRRGVLRPPRASRLTQWLIKYPSPLVMCFALWRVNLETWQLGLLPVIGALIALSTLLPAWLCARWVRLSPPRTGSMLTCAFFSNQGYLGAFTAFVLFGEEAYGLCMVYLLFFSPCFYTLGFSIASHYGHRADRDIPRPAFGDELRFYPLVGMAVGVILNLLHVPRPEGLTVVNSMLIPLDTALFLVAVGSQLTFGSLARWVRPSIVMCLIKFLYAPAVGWLLVTAFGIQGLPRFVVLLEASTPVGVSTLMFPLLFGLDRELSSALWLFTTLFAIPWLLFVIPVLQHL